MHSAQYTTHAPPFPRKVYKHARSHMTNTPFLTGQASELAYMSLYIIYLYLVKNKLHNSTNLDLFSSNLKLRFKKKRGGGGREAIEQIVIEYFHTWRGELTPKQRRWGVRGDKYKTSLQPPTFTYLFISPISEEQKEGPYRKHSFF